MRGGPDNALGSDTVRSPLPSDWETLMSSTLYMVIERFKNGDPLPVYRRFRERGRMAPEGLNYISSWVDHGLACCYQVMEAPDRALLDQWMARWSDLVDFEVHRVITSEEAVEKVGPLL